MNIQVNEFHGIGICDILIVTQIVDFLSLPPKWGAIYYFKSLWDFKSEITSLHSTNFTLVKAIQL